MSELGNINDRAENQRDRATSAAKAVRGPDYMMTQTVCMALIYIGDQLANVAMAIREGRDQT